MLPTLFPLVLPPDRSHDSRVLLGIDRCINCPLRRLEELFSGSLSPDEFVHARIAESSVFVDLNRDGDMHAELSADLKAMPLLLEYLDLLRGVVFDDAVELDFHSFAFLSFLPNGGMQNYARASIRKWA